MILLDIEGTTTPIDFVYSTLFPYARKRLDDFARTELSPEDLSQLEREYQTESDRSRPDWTNPPTAYLNWLADQDRKSSGLKSVQGKIWKAGYENGSLRGQLFADIVPAIKRWKAGGKRVCIYSSGSVLAQKLIFGYSTEGDLSGFIDRYFDTAVGPKGESASYRTIAGRMHVATEEMLFISDSAAECTAAQHAGCRVLYSIRPGNKVESAPFDSVTNFGEVEL